MFTLLKKVTYHWMSYVRNFYFHFKFHVRTSACMLYHQNRALVIPIT